MRNFKAKLALVVFPILIFGAGAIAWAQGFAIAHQCSDYLAKKDFRENPALSTLIEREGINSGLSKGEAVAHYGLDKIEEHDSMFGTSVGINTKALSGSTQAVYLVSFTNDRIGLLVKSIGRSDSSGDHMENVSGSFEQSYGVPNAEQESDGTLIMSYYVKHGDKYLMFQRALTPTAAGRPEIEYIVYDLTEKVPGDGNSNEEPTCLASAQGKPDQQDTTCR